MRSVLILAAAMALAYAAHAAPPAQNTSGRWTPPRTADGHPDFSGVWSNASVTKLTRSPSQPRLTLTPAEAKAMASSDPMVRRGAADSRPSDPGEGAPAVGDPGGYNSFWLDPGATYGQVKGEFRTSWLVDPADGQLPFTETGKKLVREAGAYLRAADLPANPEALEPWDRCIISSRGSGGPGMLNNIYNSNLQIVQSPGSVAIVIEMIHDARSIPVFASRAVAQASHGPAMHRWLGDSVAWWEGDALVVETLDVNAEQGRAGPIFLTPKGRVTERFTRASAGQILYEFQVEDPTYYTKAWRAEMSLNAMKDPLFEYACHEGNYAMAGILSGVRAAERKAMTGGGK